MHHGVNFSLNYFECTYNETRRKYSKRRKKESSLKMRTMTNGTTIRKKMSRKKS